MEVATGTALVLASAGVAVGTAPALAAWARRRYRLERRPDATLRVRTEDGWNLRVLHYRPRGPRMFEEPVVLCHGLAANSFNLDLDERHSLARHFARLGFHAFVPDLRGREGSWPDREKWKLRHDYAFDHHAVFDAPAVLQGALAATGARRAFWLGHSMGGMIGYVTAARLPDKIAGLVTLGSPARMKVDDQLSRMLRLVLRLPLDPLPQRLFAQALAPFASESFPPTPEIPVHRPNMERATMRYALANVIVDVPRRLVRQFAEWGMLEKPISEHGGVDYRDHLSSTRCPLFVIAGNADRLAPPDDVAPGFDLSPSTDRRFVVFGRDLPERYFGHGDLVLGKDSPDLVFPLISEWIAERATRAGRRVLAVPRARAG